MSGLWLRLRKSWIMPLTLVRRPRLRLSSQSTLQYRFRVEHFRVPRWLALGQTRFRIDPVLVRHPQGDLLIDTGLGRTIAEQMREFPLLFRLGTDLVRLQAAVDQLDAAGYDQRQLRYILLTHSHWDHII